jgi:exosortase/archaeosortase family protein
MHIKNNKMGHKIDLAIRVIIILGCIAYLIVSFPAYKPIPQMTSKVNAVLLNGIGIDSTPYNSFLIVSFKNVNRIYELSAECSGLILYAMFLIGIFVVPYFSFKHRLIALLFLPILFFGNALRIMASVLVGYNFSAKSSEFFHDTFGQILIFVWVILCFIVWLKITKNFPKEKMEVIK